MGEVKGSTCHVQPRTFFLLELLLAHPQDDPDEVGRLCILIVKVPRLVLQRVGGSGARNRGNRAQDDQDNHNLRQLQIGERRQRRAPCSGRRTMTIRGLSDFSIEEERAFGLRAPCITYNAQKGRITDYHTH